MIVGKIPQCRLSVAARRQPSTGSSSCVALRGYAFASVAGSIGNRRTRFPHAA
jgi:hypothetical protein